MESIKPSFFSNRSLTHCGVVSAFAHNPAKESRNSSKNFIFISFLKWKLQLHLFSYSVQRYKKVKNRTRIYPFLNSVSPPSCHLYHIVAFLPRTFSAVLLSSIHVLYCSASIWKRHVYFFTFSLWTLDINVFENAKVKSE